MAKPKPKETEAAVQEQTTAVATRDERPPAIADYALVTGGAKDVAEAIRANVGDRPLDEFTLDRIKVPGSGGTVWSVPSLDGDIDAKEIEGVIVAWKEPRAYWKTSFDESGGGTPPDCSSNDSFHGVGSPGGECMKCPLAAFGSADGKKEGEKGRGQACKQVRQLFIIQENSLIPIVITVPPTSLQGARKYFLRLASNGVPYYGVTTKFMLSKDKNTDGIPYARIDMVVGKRLNDAEIDIIRDYGAAFRPAIEGTAVQAGDIRE